MGLLDLFRPKWRHSNVEVRSEAVRALDPEDHALTEVALKDPESMVRRLAIKKIVDPELLGRIAEGDADEALRKAAAEKANEILIHRATADSDGAAGVVARLSSQKALAEVARTAAREEAWRAAIERLSDVKALAEVVRQARSAAARMEALSRVSEAGVLKSVALTERDEALCLASVARIGEVAALEQIIHKAKLKSVRNAAKERLAQVAPGREAPQSKQSTQKKAMQRQLCARAEAALKHADLDEASSEMEAVRDAWSELGPQPGDDELRLRFGKAVEKFEERRAEKSRPAPAPAPVVEKKPEEPAPEPSEAEAEALAHEEAARAERRAQKAAEKKAREEERAKKQAERDAREAKKKERDAEREAARVANKDVWANAAARLESLAQSEDRAELERALKEAGDAVDGARELPREDEAALRDRYEAARKTLAVKAQELRELDRWKSWANVPKLEQLVAKMEALAAGGVTDAKETAAALKGLQAEWKAAGPAPREKRDALWEKFKKSADEVYARVKEQFAQVDADRTANLTKKEELCARVEALVGLIGEPSEARRDASGEPVASRMPASIDFKETAETIKLLQEEWKSIGPVPKEKSDELWKRFRGACDKFFERRKAHFGEVDAARDENLKKQEELCAKVEAIADSTNFKETAELVKEYQAAWKQIGPGPRDKSEETWKRFRAACDRFFERRKSHFAEMDAERGENLRKKLLLCEKVEALAEADDESTIDVVKGLQAEWKTVGPAPKDQADEVWARFRAACDRIFDRRRKKEEEPPPAPSEAPSGISGFTNKLPLAEIAAGWADLAGGEEKSPEKK